MSKDNRLHTDKEFDSMHGLNLYDNQARMYDPIYGKFTGIDPLADHPKQIAWSPYAHCANNPLKYFDLDGKKFVFAKGSTQQFKAQAREAVRYLQKNKADGILINVHKHEKTVFLAEIKNDGYFDVSSNTIYWDPTMGIMTSNYVEMSPTTILNHELDHANQEITNPDQKTKDRSTTDTKYKNKEEKRVIEGSEQTTAKKLGEIKDGEKTRSDHYGKAYETKGSTTTEGKNDIIINGKEYEK